MRVCQVSLKLTKMSVFKKTTLLTDKYYIFATFCTHTEKNYKAGHQQYTIVSVFIDNLYILIRFPYILYLLDIYDAGISDDYEPII